jgi:hypothetical protein
VTAGAIVGNDIQLRFKRKGIPDDVFFRPSENSLRATAPEPDTARIVQDEHAHWRCVEQRAQELGGVFLRHCRSL